jgi:hypothetical protein
VFVPDSVSVPLPTLTSEPDPAVPKEPKLTPLKGLETARLNGVIVTGLLISVAPPDNDPSISVTVTPPDESDPDVRSWRLLAITPLTTVERLLLPTVSVLPPPI